MPALAVVPPEAAASPDEVRAMSRDALIRSASEILSRFCAVPGNPKPAFTRIVEIVRARAGTIEMPPAPPAFAVTSSVPLNSASMVLACRSVPLLLLTTARSASRASVFMVVTDTAMPAPMPKEASPSVEPSADTFSAVLRIRLRISRLPPSSVMTAVSSMLLLTSASL